MPMTLAYPTRLRLHLADSKRAGIPFEQAWAAACRAITYQPDEGEIGYGWPMVYTRDVFRDAYCNLTRPNGIGVLAERDRLAVAHRYVAPPAPVKSCGWGGKPCDNPAEPYLCPEHGRIVRACRGALCLHPDCGDATGKAANNAVQGEDYCRRHLEAVAA